jgi:hypothetical protein
MNQLISQASFEGQSNSLGVSCPVQHFLRRHGLNKRVESAQGQLGFGVAA